MRGSRRSLTGGPRRTPYASGHNPPWIETSRATRRSIRMLEAPCSTGHRLTCTDVRGALKTALHVAGPTTRAAAIIQKATHTIVTRALRPLASAGKWSTLTQPDFSQALRSLSLDWFLWFVPFVQSYILLASIRLVA